jgi:hypothetical protein
MTKNEIADRKRRLAERLAASVPAGSETEVRSEGSDKLRRILANALRPIMSQATADAGFSDWLAMAIEQQFILVDRDTTDTRITHPNPAAKPNSTTKES